MGCGRDLEKTHTMTQIRSCQMNYLIRTFYDFRIMKTFEDIPATRRALKGCSSGYSKFGEARFVHAQLF